MSNFNLKIFKNIDSSVTSPVYSWIWNSPITKELIKTQIDEMIEQGVRATYILPEPKEFRPNTMVTHMTPEYLSDEFFELVRYAVEYAASLHISMWLYDEGGWPSGNACGTILKKYPDAKQKCIGEKRLALNKGDTLKKSEYISAFTKSYQKLVLPYTADKPCEVYAYYTKQIDNGFTHIIDDRVVNEFIESTYEGYKKHLGDYFGNKIAAFFTDEPVIEYPYFIGDVAEFEREYGYIFEDNVYVLFKDGLSEKEKRFKIDYIEYCSRIFNERFVEPISNWCKRNNILYTGHFDGDNILGGSDLKKQVGNLMSHLRYMDIPGIDVILRQVFPTNTDNKFFPRFASSAANQTGKNLTVSESFAVYGNGLTFEQMRYVCNYQFVRGINIINFMSVTSGRDNCLSSQCRPHFIPELPEFRFRKTFNDYISRMMYICQLGKLQCDTALYVPFRDIWAGEDVENDFWSMGKALEEKQVYFDIIDDDFIVNGDLKYKNIYVPTTKFISEKAKAVIKECGAQIHYSTDIRYGLVKCDNKHIRIMKRSTENEDIYILFNEHSEKITADIEFYENKIGYLLDAYDGSAKLLSGTEFELCSGEAVAVLFTNIPIETNSCMKLVPYASITDFNMYPINKSEFANQKLCLRSEDIIVDESFSGQICYTANFDYDGSEDIVIDLGDVYYYAEIKVNGRAVKQLIMPPYTALISNRYLDKRNTLEITVSNTCANAYVFADYTDVDSSAIGPYHEKTLAFERENLKIGIEKIKLFKTYCEKN